MIADGFARLGSAISGSGIVSIAPAQASTQAPTSEVIENTNSNLTPKGKRKREHKEKEPKDPNWPKRPPSSFLFYAVENRPAVAKAHPELGYQDVTRLLGQMWDKADQKPYLDKCRREMEAWRVNVEEFKGKLLATEAPLDASPVVDKENAAKVANTPSPAKTVTATESPKKRAKKNKKEAEIEKEAVAPLVAEPETQASAQVQSPVVDSPSQFQNKKRKERKNKETKV